MNIGLDVRSVQVSSGICGINVYATNLMGAISKIDNENSYFLFTVKGKERIPLSLSADFDIKFVPISAKQSGYMNLFLDKWVVPDIINRYSLDVVHFLNPFDLRCNVDTGKYRRRTVATVHDLTPFLMRDLIFVGKRKFLKPLYMAQLGLLKHAEFIIAISENTKKDLIEHVGISENKIRVVYLGKSDVFKPVKDGDVLRRVKRRYRLPEEFLLYVGGFSLHKNLYALLESLVMLRIEYKLDIPLVIVGKLDSFFFDSLQERIDSLNLKERVIFTGFVPLDDLPAIYTLCKAFVFPSLYEGFGLPVLEALSCGTPVACSDVSSLPEVAGKSAVYFDPKSIESIAYALNKIISSDEIQERLRVLSLKQAEKFSWEKTATETIQIYEMIGKGKALS